MEDLLTSVRRFGQESSVFRVVATSLCELVHGLNKLTLSEDLEPADLEAVCALRKQFQQTYDSLWAAVDVYESTHEETAGGSVERAGDETVEIVTAAEAPQEPDSPGDAAADPARARRDYEDSLLQRWQETSEWARGNDYARQSAPVDGPGALWRALHLLYLRLPADYAAKARPVAAREAGLDGVENPDVVIPAFGDCPELDLGHSASIAPSPLGQQQQWIINACGEDVWKRHGALLGPLANVLTLLEIDDRNLILSLWQIHLQPDLDQIDASDRKNDFLDRVEQRLKKLRSHTKAVTAPSVDELDALVAVLETVRAVTYRLTPAPNSWWAKNAQDADNHVSKEFEHAGIGRFEVVTGSHPFGERTESGEDIDVNRPRWATTAKQVLWMLRPYTKLPDRDRQLGRVIYARN